MKNTRIQTRLPDSFSLANLVLGMFAIIQAHQGHIIIASALIMFGMLADTIDGRLARHLKVTSRLGIEFDTLADLTTFGAATSFLVYVFAFQAYAWGVLIPLVGVACVAIRLARFTVKHQNTFFQGLPSLAWALLVISIVTSPFSFEPFVVAIIVIGGAVLMISPIKYPTFKKLNPRQKHLLAGVGLLAILAIVFLPAGLLFVVIFYIVIGPLLHTQHQRKTLSIR